MFRKLLSAIVTSALLLASVPAPVQAASSSPPATIQNITGLQGALRVVGPRLVALGDSITAGSVGGASNSGYQQQGISFDAIAGLVAGNVVRFIHNAGVAGNTTTQIVARYATDVTPFAPNVVLILGGTNDMSSTSGISLATSEANIKTLVANTLAINATPILATIPPKIISSTVGATELARLMTFNAWLRAYAAKNNYPLVDLFAKLVDAQTASYQASYVISTGGATGGSYTLAMSTRVAGGVRQTWATTNTTVNSTSASIAYNAANTAIATALSNASSRSNSFLVFGSNPTYKFYSVTGYPFDITVAADSTTGGTGVTVTQIVALTADGTHPTDPQGVKIMANAVAATLQQLYPPNSTLPLSMLSTNNSFATSPVADVTNLIQNGSFTYDSGFTGLASTFWTLNTGVFNYTTDVPLPSDNLVGQWLTATTKTTTGGAYVAQAGVGTVGTNVNVGDTIAFSGRIRTTNFESPYALPWVAPLNTFNIELVFTSGGVINPRAASAWDINLTDGYFYIEAVVPVGTTFVGGNVYMTGSGTVRIGQMSVIDLTTMGTLNP